MKIRINLITGLILSCILTGPVLVSGQEEEANKAPEQEMQSDSETQWIWGDVVSLGAAAKTILVKYLDYETDIEKEISIILDDKTTYENVKSIEEIKPNDTISVDYIANPDGKNIAKNISIERPEGAQNLPEEGIKEEPKTAEGTE